jgi:hypothetical protein
VGLGAIIVVGAKNGVFSEAAATSSGPADDPLLLGSPLACFEILGRSSTERMIERFVRVEVDVISVLVEADVSFQMPPLRGSFANLSIQIVSDAEQAVGHKLREYSLNGIDRAFVQSAEAYTETDLLDLFYFHREARQIATRAFDRNGALPLWVVDTVSVRSNLEKLLGQAGKNGASYFLRGYVHRLGHPRDLRRIAEDMLRGSCDKGATGKEIRTGLWIEDGARVDRRARIVGPAYIGCRSKVRAESLVTRFSNVERDCCVDYGTVVEDSSLLPHTHVGIWLDVCHAVANGSRLFSLVHDVGVEISDSNVLRSTVPALSAGNQTEDWNDKRLSAADFEPECVTPSTWQLDASFIQE